MNPDVLTTMEDIIIIMSQRDKAEAQRDALLEALQGVYNKPDEAVSIMKEHHIVIDNLDDTMQKFAFTLYSMLLELQTEAQIAINQVKESTDES